MSIPTTGIPTLLKQKPLFLHTNAEVVAFMKRACPNGLRTGSGDMKGSVLSENNSRLNINDSYRQHTTYEVNRGKRENTFFDLSFLIKDETSSLKGNLDSEKDVDFYQFTIPYSRTFQNYFDIAVTMELPEGCDYDLTLYDQYGNQVGKAIPDGNGKKTLHVPNWDTKTSKYCLKVENKNGQTVDAEDFYRISFQMSENKDSAKTDAVREAYIKYNDDYVHDRESCAESLTKYNQALKEMEEAYGRELDILHQKQYESLPDDLQYRGDKSAAELVQDMAEGRELTEAETEYVKIYANLQDYEKALQKNNLKNEFSAQILSDLEKVGISADDLEGMEIRITADGTLTVSGIMEDKKEQVEKLLSENYSDKLYNAYIGIADSLTGLTSTIYQFAMDVQEAMRFLSKASGEDISLDNLYFTTDGKIGGLPVNLTDLVNKTENNVKIEMLRDSLRNIISYKQTYGAESIPYFTTAFTFSNGSFQVNDHGFDMDIEEFQDKINSLLSSMQTGNMYESVYHYQFKDVL